MAKFSKYSKEQLESCDKRIQAILNEAIKIFDFRVICGHRGELAQNEVFEKGYSKLKFPKSKHNESPSKAVDIAPYPIDWENRKRFYYLQGIIRGIANCMGIYIRQGVDWDGDGKFKDQHFDDLPHWELKE